MTAAKRLAGMLLLVRFTCEAVILSPSRHGVMAPPTKPAPRRCPTHGVPGRGDRNIDEFAFCDCLSRLACELMRRSHHMCAICGVAVGLRVARVVPAVYIVSMRLRFLFRVPPPRTHLTLQTLKTAWLF